MSRYEEYPVIRYVLKTRMQELEMIKKTSSNTLQYKIFKKQRRLNQLKDTLTSLLNQHLDSKIERGRKKISKLKDKIGDAENNTEEALDYTDTLNHIIHRLKMQKMYDKKPYEKLEGELLYINQ